MRTARLRRPRVPRLRRRWHRRAAVAAAGAAGVALWLGLADVQASNVTVSLDGFDLSCPTSASEGDSLTCTLTNTNDEAAAWPVVGIIHLSSDSDRALVVGTPVDVEFGTQTPDATIDTGVTWIGDVLVGYSRFDWTGDAPASTDGDDTDQRTVTVTVIDDTAWEEGEAFYVTLASDGLEGVGFLYDNRQRVSISQSDSKSSDATLQELEVRTAGLSTPTVWSPPGTTQSLEVSYKTTSLTVTAEATYKPSGISVVVTHGGTESQRFDVADGEESQAVFLDVGAVTVSVTVTAENGTSTQTYDVVATRADLADPETSTVTAQIPNFDLSCPAVAFEGAGLTCSLTNTSSQRQDWPLVAFLHSSADDDRALITEDPLIPDTSTEYRRDVSLADPQSPAVEAYNYGYGELFSGGSRSVYITYGYEKFDWTGTAAPGASRDVVLTIPDDEVAEGPEIIYAALAPSDYTGFLQIAANTVPIIVRDINRVTVTGTADPSVVENTNVIATYSASDPQDTTTFTWSLAGDDAGDFTITDGVLVFTQAPDYESPADSDTDNVYRVTVQASNGGATGGLDVEVSVTDASPEAPRVIGPSSVTLDENDTAVATYTAEDDDGDTVTWSLAGDDADDFSITDGVLAFGTAPNYESPADSDTDNVYRVTAACIRRHPHRHHRGDRHRGERERVHPGRHRRQRHRRR